MHYTAHPVIGGVEGVVEEHRALLQAAGYDVRVVAGRGDAEIVPELDSRHPEIEALTRRLQAGEPAGPAFDDLRRRLEAGLDRALAAADVVVAHNVPTMHFNLPATAALAARALVAWVHDLTWVNPRYREWRRPGDPYSLLHTPAPGHRHVAISRLRGGEVRQTLGVEAEVIPNGVGSSAMLQVRESTLDLLRGAGCWPADEIVLIPFRLTRRKRIELAIEVAACLKASRPGLRWIVSGPLGPHSSDNADYLASLRRRRAELGLDREFILMAEQAEPHPVDAEMIPELYRVSSAVFLPTESEGFGLPVIEAGLNHLPVLATDLPVLAEVGDGNITTFPVDAEPSSIATTLAGILDSPEGILKRRVYSEFSWEALLPRIEAVLEAARG